MIIVNHQSYISKNQRGFTLFELLIYIALASILIGGISTLLFITLNARVKNQTIAEVEQQGSLAMRMITQSIRNADAILSPIAGSAGTLILDVVGAVDDPTVYELSDTTLEITQGEGSAVALTNDRVSVSDLTFTLATQGSGSGTIRVQFTVSHVNTSGRQEYAYSQTFYGTANIR